MRPTYNQPFPGESERDWVARSLYWVSRSCAESHEAPCARCAKRKRYIREADLSGEHGSAAALLSGLWSELSQKARDGAGVAGAFPRGKRSKASVYVLLDANGDHLYVGKAKNVRFRIWNRSNGHSVTKPWFHEVAHVVVQDYETEGDAFDAEAMTIYNLQPRYNKAIPEVPVRAPMPVDHWVYESPEEVRA